MQQIRLKFNQNSAIAVILFLFNKLFFARIFFPEKTFSQIQKMDSFSIWSFGRNYLKQ